MKKYIIILLLLTNTICYSKSIQWTKVFDDDSLTFMGIDNADSNYCMAVGCLCPYKSIYKSTDAGSTWNCVYKDTFIVENWELMKDPYDISYPTRDFCIIGCDSSYFLKTTDGGVSWKEYKIDIPYSPYGFYDVDMYDEKNGILTSSYYTAISHDGFKTYELIPNPGGFVAYCAELAAPNSICILSRDVDSTTEWNERFYRSDDGGKTWDEYLHPDYRIPVEIQFIDSLIGYEIGPKRTGHGQPQYELVYKTTDGGRSWEKVLDTVIKLSFGLQKLDFYDKDNGIVVGQFGAVFWTHDGGNSWIFDSSAVIYDNIPATMNVCYIKKDRAIVADFHGRIFISEDTTTDVVEEIPNDGNFVLYPNPASDYLLIKSNTIALIEIYNILGLKVLETEYKDRIDVSRLSAGVYYLRIYDRVIQFVKI